MSGFVLLFCAALFASTAATPAGNSVKSDELRMGREGRTIEVNPTRRTRLLRTEEIRTIAVVTNTTSLLLQQILLTNTIVKQILLP